MYEYDIGVVIGRMQPLHQGHMTLIEEGLRRARFVVVLIGSAYQARSTRNPFNENEREEMIARAFSDPRVITIPIQDSNYNTNSWIEQVYTAVTRRWSENITQRSEPKIALIGHKKDATSYYLDMFPSWESILVENSIGISSTDIRQEIFNSDVDFSEKNWTDNFVSKARKKAPSVINNNSFLHPTTKEFLIEFSKSQHFDTVAREFAFASKYKNQWKDAPYAPTFVTSDACVVQSGHVLLIKRNSYPGMGLWAMPGGFVETTETPRAAALRELKEETGIKVSEGFLDSHITKVKTFDDPHRSSRGRTITFAHLIDLGTGALPRVKQDQKDEETQMVKWRKLSDLEPSEFFEDHYQIIRNLIQKF